MDRKGFFLSLVLVLAVAMIFAGCLGGGGKTGNRPPTIDSATPSQTDLAVETGATIDFSVTASDPDGDALGYVWDQTGGGIFTSTDESEATWKAPDWEETASVTVTVSDGKDGVISHRWDITVEGPTSEEYSSNDYQKLVSFLGIEDHTGEKNGEKLNVNYDPNEPTTWTGIEWNDDSPKRVKEIEIYFGSLIGSLDVSDCSALERIRCNENQLSSLDVSGCSALGELWCSGNQLSFLDVSDCSALTWLLCSGNQLSSLDVSDCSALKQLGCGENLLTSLDVTNCPNLRWFSCWDNEITSLDVSDCSALEELSCQRNRFASLDVSGCSALGSLWCGSNQLTSLDVSDCSVLKQLDCGENQLISLDVSDCLALEELYCYRNQLTSLDVSQLTNLEKLRCDDNFLQSLLVNGCSDLWYINCSQNRLTELNVTDCTHPMELYHDAGVSIIGRP